MLMMCMTFRVSVAIHFAFVRHDDDSSMFE
jgi:hypothetical protein